MFNLLGVPCVPEHVIRPKKGCAIDDPGLGLPPTPAPALLEWWNATSNRELSRQLHWQIETKEPFVFLCKDLRWSIFGEMPSRGRKLIHGWMVTLSKGRLQAVTIQVQEVPRVWTLCQKLSKGGSRNLRKKSRGRLEAIKKGKKNSSSNKWGATKDKQGKA